MANPFVAVGGFFGRFFGNTIGEAAAYGIGGAMQEPLRPALQALANETWAAAAKIGVTKPPTIYTVAPAVAAGHITYEAGRQWAHEYGYNDAVFDALVAASKTGPAFGTLMETYRRGEVDTAGFEKGLKRLHVESDFWPALKALKDVLLSPAELANARQQGFIPQARQESEAALQGIDAERADIQFELAGLPLGVETMQFAANRGLADRGTFDQAIREGHTKTKYTDLAWSLRLPVLSALNYVEARLRGFATTAEMDAGGALHGYTSAQMDLLFKIHGRPISFRQAFIGTRRGGVLDGPTTGIEPAFLASLRRSNIQPSFYDLAWAQRYTYPSAFVLRALTQSGDITQARAEQVLLFEGWEPGFAKQVAAAWAGGSGTSADTHEGKAQTQLWGTLHRSYVAEESDDATATATLSALGVDAAVQPRVLALWNQERDLIRKQLTPAQIKKAWVKNVLNPSTGAAWTRDEALAGLIARGYAPADANTFLEI